MKTEISEKPILFSGPMVRAILDGRKTQTRRVVKWPIPDGATSCGVFSTRDDTLNGRWQFLDGDPEDADSWGWIGEDFACPYGKPGDRLWVRETFCQKTEDGIFVYNPEGNLDPSCYHYAADGYEVLKDDGDGGTEYRKDGSTASPWKPSIFMPRNASRILLEITDIRVERVQEISEADAIAEGLEPTRPLYGDCGGYVHEGHKEAFRILWDQLNCKRGVCKTCKGFGIVPAWSGSVDGGSLMQDSKDCPDCHGKETGCGWDANPFVWVITFRRV